MVQFMLRSVIQASVWGTDTAEDKVRMQMTDRKSLPGIQPRYNSPWTRATRNRYTSHWWTSILLKVEPTIDWV